MVGFENGQRIRNQRGKSFPITCHMTLRLKLPLKKTCLRHFRWCDSKTDNGFGISIENPFKRHVACWGYKYLLSSYCSCPYFGSRCRLTTFPTSESNGSGTVGSSVENSVGYTGFRFFLKIFYFIKYLWHPLEAGGLGFKTDTWVL